MNAKWLCMSVRFIDELLELPLYYIEWRIVCFIPLNNLANDILTALVRLNDCIKHALQMATKTSAGISVESIFIMWVYNYLQLLNIFLSYLLPTSYFTFSHMLSLLQKLVFLSCRHMLLSLFLFLLFLHHIFVIESLCCLLAYPPLPH